jgi:hypothetical protein
VPALDAIQPLLQLGAGGLLVIAVWAFVTERVVPGSAYRRALAERDAAFARLARFVDVVEAATKLRAPD